MNEEEFIQMDKGGVGDWWYDARREMLERELSSTSLKSGAKILDLAAACGGNFDICSQYGKVIGLDISWSSIDYCKKKKRVCPWSKLMQKSCPLQRIYRYCSGPRCIRTFKRRLLFHAGNTTCFEKDTGKLIFNTPAFMALFQVTILHFIITDDIKLAT